MVVNQCGGGDQEGGPVDATFVCTPDCFTADWTFKMPRRGGPGEPPDVECACCEWPHLLDIQIGLGCSSSSAIPSAGVDLPSMSAGVDLPSMSASDENLSISLPTTPA